MKRSPNTFDQVPSDQTGPLVSVIVPTYQHASYITTCLNGILEQQTDFHVEILIGEDESTDGTREICQRYAAAHPDRIRLFLRSRKDVMHIMGRPTGRANLLDLLNATRGRYIAICEGDDYWIDPLKLQNQVGLLEQRPEASACFTDAYNERDGVRTNYLDGQYTRKPGPQVEQSELLNAQGLPTCTVVFRREALLPLPPGMNKAPTGDTLMYVHAANKGPFLYLPVHTAVRRMHPGGLHSLASEAHQALVTLRNLPFLDEASHFRHHDLIQARRKRIVLRHWASAVHGGHWELARYCWKEMAKMRREVGWSLPVTLRNYLKAFWPSAEKRLGGVWDRLRGRRSPQA